MPALPFTAFRERPVPVAQAALIALCCFGWLLFAGAVAAYVLVSALGFREPFHVGLRPLQYFDLRIYRSAASRLWHERPLYARPIIRKLGFTYPPAAALLLAPLTLLSLKTDELGVTAVNLVMLVWMLRRALEIARQSLPGAAVSLARPAIAWSLAALAAGFAVWLEPVTVALGYGQIDFLIAALVVFDVSRPDAAQSKGAAIGLAAGLKLTPLLFIPYLIFSRRPRAALIAALTFAATVAVSFAVTPHDASRYWGRLVLHSSRVGGAPDVGNQSLRGAIARLTATAHPGATSLLAVVLVGLIGIALAVRASRRGNEAFGFSLCAITTLLCSPISWTHHWVLAVPALLLLALTAYEQRSRVLLLATAALLAAGWAYLPERSMHHPPALGGLGTLTADPYVLIGLSVLVCAGVAMVAPRRSGPTPGAGGPPSGAPAPTGLPSG